MMILITVLLLIIFIEFLIIIFRSYLDLTEETRDKKHSIDSAWGLPELKATVDLDEWIKEHCTKCRWFDGYDFCMNKKHSGAMIQNSVEYCKSHSSFTKKK